MREEVVFSDVFLTLSVIADHNLWYNCLRCEYVLYHYQTDSAQEICRFRQIFDKLSADSCLNKEREGNMLPADPDMLASFLNMKLRDHYATLDALCEDLELNKEEIVNKLKEADYDYIPARNQFL